MNKVMCVFLSLLFFVVLLVRCSGKTGSESDPVVLPKQSLTLVVGYSYQLEATSGTALTWVSNNESLATVSASGLVTAKAEGSLMVKTITSGGYSEEWKCSIIPASSSPFTITSTASSVTIAKYSGSEENVIVPASINGITVTTITINAFFNSNIKSVTIPSGVTSINPAAFNGCSGLVGIYVDPDNLNYKDVDGVLFDKAGKMLHKYPAEKNGTYSIPAGVESIYSYAFNDCSLLSNVEFPSTLKTINMGAFWGCTGLTSITIPSNITLIAGSAFQNCSNLETVICQSLTPPPTGSSFLDGTSASLSIKVPSAALSAYQDENALYWTSYKTRIIGI